MAPIPPTSRIIHSTVGGIELSDDQKAAIKDATGDVVEWLLFTESKDHVARALDSSAISVTRLTWCW